MEDKEKLIEKIKNNDFETFSHQLHEFNFIETYYNKNGKK